MRVHRSQISEHHCRNHRKSHLVQYSAMIFLLSVLLFAGCEEKVKPTVTNAAITQDFPTQESWNTTITMTDSGKLASILRAGHISSYADKQYTVFDSNVVVDFYDDQEHHTSVLTSRTGKVDDMTHDLEAHGNVVVVSDSGTTLRTEDLYWNNRTKKVYTPAFVDIVSPTEHIQGHGFESDRGLHNYSIFKVTGKVKSDQ